MNVSSTNAPSVGLYSGMSMSSIDVRWLYQPLACPQVHQTYTLSRTMRMASRPVGHTIACESGADVIHCKREWNTFKNERRLIAPCIVGGRSSIQPEPLYESTYQSEPVSYAAECVRVCVLSLTR
jgi:hypothetical protein